MDAEQISKIFETEGITTEIKCPEAFALSDKYGITRMEISRYCNQKGVKIRACQLGCFQ